MTGKILVTGATGNLGGAVLDSLISKGIEVKAVSRNPIKFKPRDNVDVVTMNYEDMSTHEAALEGVEGVFLIAPPLDPLASPKLFPFIDKAKEMGVEHIVFTSAYGIEGNEESPLRVIEHHLMGSEVPYTILRPNFFMENFTSGFIGTMILTNFGIFIAAGNGKTSFISVKDVAQVAAIAFDQCHYNKEYNLTGVESLDHAEIAAVISKISGKDIKYEAISADEMIQGAMHIGLPAEVAEYMGMLYGAVASGYVSGVTDDFEKVTGRKPLTFAQFAEKNTRFW